MLLEDSFEILNLGNLRPSLKVGCHLWFKCVGWCEATQPDLMTMMVLLPLATLVGLSQQRFWGSNPNGPSTSVKNQFCNYKQICPQAVHKLCQHTVQNLPTKLSQNCPLNALEISKSSHQGLWYHEEKRCTIRLLSLVCLWPEIISKFDFPNLSFAAF